MNVAGFTQQRDHRRQPGGPPSRSKRSHTTTRRSRAAISPSLTTAVGPGGRCPRLRGNVGLSRVAIVDRHLLFAQALEIALTLEGYDVHRQDISDGAMPGKLLTRLVHARPEIALLDLDLVGVGQSLGSSSRSPAPRSPWSS